MIIKIIPEEGEDHIQEIEHKNIHEFFIFGNKKDEDGDFADFHDWKGSYRYLLGSLAYFSEEIKDEKKASSQSTPSNIKNVVKPQIEIKPPTEDVEDVEEDADNIIPLDPKINKGNKRALELEAIEVEAETEGEEGKE